MVKDDTLYKRLNIKPNSNLNEIKKGYRKMSMKWHPDKNPNNKQEATKEFQKISEAYSILSDEEKRKLYDQIGMDILKEGHDNNFDPSSIFEQFFGGMGGNPFGGMPFGFNNDKKDENCYTRVNVTLKQIYNEENVDVTYKQKNYCKNCDGTGSKTKSESKCSNCNGTGKVVKIIRMGPMIQQAVSVCNVCNGTKRSIKKEDYCSICSGEGFVIKNKKITIPLKNGINTGNKIKMDNKGNYFKNYKTDLIIEVHQIEDKKFKRKDDNLIIEIELKLYQSLLGFNKIIKHLDGRKLHISYKKIVKEGAVKIIKNEGMVNLNTGKKGDLHIIFNVKYPNLNILEKKESDILKVLLAKTERDEFDRETSIFKNKKKYIKTKLIDMEDYLDDEDEEQNHGEGPQCVQQ